MRGDTTLPTGTVTFLFTDIEGSTRLLQELGDAYEDALGTHRRILREAFDGHGGREVGTEGDSFFVAFERASDAVASAVAGQVALTQHEWPDGKPVRVRMGIHTGEAQVSGDDYIGLAVHQAARVRDAAHGGQVLVSQTTRDLVVQDLPEGSSLVDLGEHRLKDLAQPVRLYNLAHSELQAELPPPRSLSVLPNNLPVQLTTFVGRAGEIEKVRGLLGSTRLLTLTGPGGSGKTRLGLQVAADLVTSYPNGVWLVDLAPVTDPELIVRQIAEALGVREERDRTLAEVLVGFLQGRDLLVVVDNCEHLAVEVAEVVDRLLHAAAGLTVMATSREPLGAEGETVFRVPSLGVPEVDEPVDAVASHEAVRLFCDRAERATTEFALTDDNAGAVAEVCLRLDGMPLAIELAAARVRMLTPGEIAKRLDDRFKLLTGGVRTGFRRQQTLRAAVDWSYDLLSEAEQLLFRRLAVFVGGFGLEAAEGVCSGDGIEEGEVFDLLSNLVDRSLVVAEPKGGTTRYRLLETMREYGREALAASGEASVVFDRHLSWLATLAEEAEPHLEGGDQVEWLERVATELENIRQALSWATADGDDVAGVRLASALGRFWTIRGHEAEAARRLDELYATCADQLSLELKAKALARLGGSLIGSGEADRARTALEECVGLPREPAILEWVAEAVSNLGYLIALLEHDMVQEREAFEEALALKREAGHDFGVAESLRLISQLHGWMGEHEEADRLVAEAMAVYERIGNRDRLAELRGRRAMIASHRGDFEESIEFFEDALRMGRELGDTSMVVSWLSNIARVHKFMGDFADAERVLADAFAACRDTDHDVEHAHVARQRGQLEITRGDLEGARPHIEEFIRRMDASPTTAPVATYGHLDLSTLYYYATDIAGARAHIDETMSTMEEFQHGNELAYLRAMQARIARAEGDRRRAREFFMEARSLALELGRPLEIAECAHELAILELDEGNTGSARECLAEALRLRHRTQQRPRVIRTLEAFAWLESTEAHPERAATLLGAAAGLREHFGITMFPIDEPAHDEAVATAREQLGQAFSEAWDAGVSSSLDEAVGFALSGD